jgi:hypothetical protein
VARLVRGDGRVSGNIGGCAVRRYNATAIRSVVIRRAGGVGASGLPLADEVIAVLGDGGGLAARLREPVAGLAAAAGGPASADAMMPITDSLGQ